MTTAHKPTWVPAKGGKQQGGNRYFVPTRSFSARDLPGYLSLKHRQSGQGNQQGLQNMDFKKELLRRQQEQKKKKYKSKDQEQQSQQIDLIKLPHKKIHLPPSAQAVQQNNLDSDNPDFLESESSSSSEEQKRILQQFNIVRRQREHQQKMKFMQKVQKGYNEQGGYSLKKRWYEDSVFKNQGKIQRESKGYINDNVRSQFHRKFINKYVMR